MVKTIILDMPTNFVIAHFLMWAGRNHITEDSGFWTKPLKLSWAYSLLVFIPVTGWFFYQQPGWSTVYLRPENLIPAWSGPVILSNYFLGMVLGTISAQYFLKEKNTNGFWLSLIIGIIWLASVWILTLDEYLYIGTYAEYHAGSAIKIFDNQEFMNKLNFMGTLLATPVLLLAAYLWKSSPKKAN